jgi:LPXTG-motif cell wall-anchored protein
MKKSYRYFFWLVISIGLVHMGFLTSYAAEQKNVPSQGNVGFYGSYERLEESTEASTNFNETVPSTEKPESANSGVFLPHTGEKKGMYLIVIGAVIISITFWVIVKKQRKEDKK